MDRRRVFAVFAVAAALAGPGCGEGPDESDPIVVDLEFENPRLEVVPDELRFTHVVGQSDCPQVIGRVRIRHRLDATFIYRVRVAPPLALRVGQQFTRSRDVPVGRGEGEEIEVVFDCSSQDSPVVQTVTFTEGVEVRGSFRVNGTVVR
jgi:hypothetical protein